MNPKSIGRYQIRGEIGQGGMAIVYHAFDPHVERDVALKVMLPAYLTHSTFRQRFIQEARTVAALDHPAIVPLYDFGEENNSLYLVMRYMPGGSLREQLAQRQQIPLEEVGLIIHRLATALERAHDNHIVHRDLKPGNILFDQFGEAYLSDFGIARLANSEQGLTGSNIIGTPAFMSPEQVYGDRPVTHLSDVYALGCLLYLMLTGNAPYEGDTPTKQMMAHIMAPVPQILDERPDLPAGFADVIEQVLAKEADERHPSALALANAVTRLIATKPNEPPPIVAPIAVKAPPAPNAQLSGRHLIQESHRDYVNDGHEFVPPAAASAPMADREPATTWIWGAIGILLLTAIMLGSYYIFQLFTAPDNATIDSVATREAIALAVPSLVPTDPPLPPTMTVEQLPTELATTSFDPLNPIISSINAQRVAEYSRIGRGTIEEIALDPTGTTLAVSGGIGVWLYDSIELIPSQLLSGHLRSTRTVSWSPDGQWLASGSDDGTLRIWSATTHQAVAILSGHSDWVRMVDWSLDGVRLVSASSDGSARLWSLNDALTSASNGNPIEITESQLLDQFPTTARSVAWSPDGTHIGVGVNDGTVWIYNSNNGSRFRQLTGLGSAATAIDWSPDSIRLAAVNTEGQLLIWHIPDNMQLHNFNAHSGRILTVSFSPSGQRLATGGGDNAIRLWDSASGAELGTLAGHLSTVRSVTWVDDNQLLSGGIDGTLRRWDTLALTELQKVEGHMTSINSISWSPDGENLALGISDNSGRLWQLSDLTEYARLSDHSSWVSSISWSPLGDQIGTADFNGQIRLWPANAVADVLQLGSHRAIVNVVAWSHDGQQLASGGKDGTVRLWRGEADEDSILLTHDASIEAVAWSPDNQWLAAGDANGIIHIWSLESGTVAFTMSGHTGDVNSLDWSPDGKRLLSGSNDRSIRVWSIANGQMQLQLIGHDGWVNSVAWSPSGSVIASGGFDGTVKLWDGETGRSLNTLEGHRYAIWTVAWSPDGRLLASASGDGTVRLWAVAPDSP